MGTPLHRHQSMGTIQTYTINEAAALTGLHRNTIRGRIRLGQLKANIQQGKFGEEYRITHAALVESGLLPGEGPLGDTTATDVLEAELSEPHEEEPSDEADGADGGLPPESVALARSTLSALGELYQRHEQAMFRLGYLQGELDRVKALAEQAESLQQSNTTREQELQNLKQTLTERERQAAEAERLRDEVRELRARLAEFETLQKDLESLKALVAEQEAVIETLESAAAKPWWSFWRRPTP